MSDGQDANIQREKLTSQFHPRYTSSGSVTCSNYFKFHIQSKVEDAPGESEFDRKGRLLDSLRLPPDLICQASHPFLMLHRLHPLKRTSRLLLQRHPPNLRRCFHSETVLSELEDRGFISAVTR